MKKILAIVLALSMLFALAACGGTSAPAEDKPADTPAETTESSGATYKLRLGAEEAQGMPQTDAAYDFAEMVAEATNGDIEITVYPAAQLGDYEVMFEGLTNGSLDLAFISGPASFDQMMDIQGIPYLVENWDQAEALWGNREGYLYSKFDEVFAGLNVKLLGVLSGGFLGIGGASLGDLDTIWDPTAHQDALCRHPSMDVAHMIVDALGYNSVTIAYSDLYSALQTGTCDCWYGGGSALNYNSFRDVIDYYADYRYLFNVLIMGMSQDVFDTLPADYQQILIDCAIQVQADEFAMYEEFENNAYAQLEEAGITVLYPTDEEMAAIAGHVRDEVYPQLYDLFGADVVDAISEQVAGLS